MPLKCFLFIDEQVLTLVEGSSIDFDKLGRRRRDNERATMAFKYRAKLATKPPKMYDVRQSSDARMAEMLAAVKKSTK